VTETARTVRALSLADAGACDAIVSSLPYHFGLEAGRAECARAVRRDEGLVGIVEHEVAGFLTWRPWFAIAREITWMAVHADRRGVGIGSALIDRLVEQSPPGLRYLVVTTLAESTPEPSVQDGYARTRRFYRRNGFEPVWEPTGWWSERDQAVLMLRALV
jgi:ribosomal protein S18 acetylase RimI-like enzyme